MLTPEPAHQTSIAFLRLAFAAYCLNLPVSKHDCQQAIDNAELPVQQAVNARAGQSQGTLSVITQCNKVKSDVQEWPRDSQDVLAQLPSSKLDYAVHTHDSPSAASTVYVHASKVLHYYAYSLHATVYLSARHE